MLLFAPSRLNLSQWRTPIASLTAPIPWFIAHDILSFSVDSSLQLQTGIGTVAFGSTRAASTRSISVRSLLLLQHATLSVAALCSAGSTAVIRCVIDALRNCSRILRSSRGSNGRIFGGLSNSGSRLKSWQIDHRVVAPCCAIRLLSGCRSRSIIIQLGGRTTEAACPALGCFIRCSLSRRSIALCRRYSPSPRNAEAHHLVRPGRPTSAKPG